jgi:cysteine desulfurase
MSFFKPKLVYADYAATTPLDRRVFKAMKPYFEESFYNPSSSYKKALEVRAAIENAREVVADLLVANPEEIIFTSGGTESDNLALVGIANAYKDKGRHIISVASEHHAITKNWESS